MRRPSWVVLLAGWLTLALGTGVSPALGSPAPHALTSPASMIGEAGAELHGLVDPEGASLSYCDFEYGTTTAYGSIVECSQNDEGAFEFVGVSAEIRGLQPQSTYHFKLLVGREGIAEEGEDESFRTLAQTAAPTVTTLAPRAEETSAPLHGSVDPNGEQVTECYFEFGITAYYGSSAPCGQTLGAGSGAEEVSAAIDGLLPAQLYYARLVAVNSTGQSFGGDYPFETLFPSEIPYRAATPEPTLTPNTTGKQPTYYGSPRASGGALSGSSRARCLSELKEQSNLRHEDAGLYVHYCYAHASSSALRARAAGTSEAGWPPDQCLKMDKGLAGRRHTLVGVHGLHNWLLGGYGNDTIIGGNIGDVIWADYQPSGEPRHQTATIRAGNGRSVIYANDTVNYVWTGTNPRTLVHAHNPGTSGVIHCQSPGVVVFLSTVSERSFKLDGCKHVSHYSVGY